ncbi:glycosyltransferase family 1 protein [Ferrimicrobium sp.]|uniref:glycosyltransferase family 4 protein n=1 Tax=Ferrimicrobium sp. TaxID=2926050 RepID=UPI002614F8E1|nr:glycosyltransferase family 1 protein [Ferrimicrobium sp.]
MNPVAIDATSIPNDPTGVGRYAKELVAALYQLEDRPPISLLTTRASLRLFALPPRGNYENLIAAPNSRPLRLLYQERSLGSIAIKGGARVFHGLHYQVPAARHKLRVISTIHDLTFFDNPEWHEPAKVRYFQRAIRLAVKRSDALIVPSQATADRLRNHFPTTPPIHVIYHGVDPLLVPEHGGDEDDAVELCSLGTIEPRKNLARVLQAFDKVSDQYPNWRLRIIGKRGWKTSDFDAALDAMRNRSCVSIEGYLEEKDLRRALRRARAMIYVSNAEGFGLPVLEALASGLNVVTSNKSAMAEVAGEYAWLADPDDVDAIAHGIEMAALTSRTPDEIERQVNWARSFTWERAARETTSLYCRLLEA